MVKRIKEIRAKLFFSFQQKKNQSPIKIQKAGCTKKVIALKKISRGREEKDCKNWLINISSTTPPNFFIFQKYFLTNNVQQIMRNCLFCFFHFNYFFVCSSFFLIIFFIFVFSLFFYFLFNHFFVCFFIYFFLCSRFLFSPHFFIFVFDFCLLTIIFVFLFYFFVFTFLFFSIFPFLVFLFVSNQP